MSKNEDAAIAADYEFYCEDLGRKVTVRGYLIALLETLWREGEGFSGKRPFGNSGWEYDLYAPLIKGGFVPGKMDEFGYVDEVDADAANTLVLGIIADMAKPA